MHIIEIPPGTNIGTTNSRVTNKGAGSIIGTLYITFATGSAVTISDQPNGANAITIMSAGSPTGLYVLPLNAISRSSDWWISTTASVRVVATTPHPARVI